MISRLVRMAAALFGYFCVATILSQGIVLAYLTTTWDLDREKVARILAVAQGVDLQETDPQADGDRSVSAEQVSYEQIRETRAVKVRDLELREQALKQGLEQLTFQRQTLSDAMARQEQLRATFQQELVALHEGAVATGLENARTKLESLKPAQAKLQLAEMLGNNELDEVVTLLAGMSDSKASKIMAEFKTPEEQQQLYEILRRIREGYPDSQLAANTQSQLNQTAATPQRY